VTYNIFHRNAGRYVVNYMALYARRCICCVSINCFVIFAVMSSVLQPSCCGHYIWWLHLTQAKY